ncbi:MAG: undecaprenyl/decaprenyl-phosphate alpha-N-acetylglucosaminyl 1-phosphate transferase [Prevotellaceae bacterium]|jgi:UDP-N-acetylmuramyl pentapeptide phosphotransferase/UDP-N-acetylglucosamine-1-phosphate transferase|nr:undecaprenyl/decaprenyl-phosphate alpha-N-acetylglucosaminyl 1-phosphate transferase [Prevotellaceae bacterium]
MDFSDIKVYISFVVAVVIGFFLIPKVIKIAMKKNLVAKPNHRTSHKGTVPNVGGISIFISFILSFFLFADIAERPEIQYLLFSVIALFFVGLYDDILIISAKRKLVGEAAGISIMIFLGNFRFTNLHGFFGIYELPYFVSILLTFFVIVVIINALNLVDGIDGLAAGIGMLVSLFFGIYFLLIEKLQLTIVSFSLLGALLPFFLYNVFAKRNKVFMGDAGALVLGLILAALAIEFNELNIPATANPHIYQIANAPMVSICILILPLFDTLRVFTIRLAQKKSPFSPDKNHLHHMFLALGYNHKQSTGILLAINTVYIIIGLLFQHTVKIFFFVIVFISCLIWSETVRMYIKIKEKNKEKEREKCNEVFS